MTKPLKLTFKEAWDSSTVFLVDDELEDRIDEKVADLLTISQNLHIQNDNTKVVEDVIDFLSHERKALDVILRDIGLSDEKFMRIISLLRKINWIPGGFDREWSISSIKRRFSTDKRFMELVANLLLDGKRNKDLVAYIPRFYLDKLNYREIGTPSQVAREIRYKEAAIGTYSAMKGNKIESMIKDKLDAIEAKHGISYEKGRSRIIDVDIDFAVPSLDNAWVIIMSSFQETTSSGQTTKARDMRAAYNRINDSNSRHKEKRVFVNFVDGGGWLARKSDFERLVDECHYFINLQNLNLIEPIVLAHTPASYIKK